jgi:BlaI family transcriptional regulator, penicillinase repressor
MSAVVSETELAVLKVLWDQGPGTVREVLAVLQGQGRKWAYTTVQTLLNRLQAKGCAASDKGGPAYVYRAVTSREQHLQKRLHDLADEFCEGTASPLVLALVEGGRFTAADLDRFRQLLDQMDTDRPRKKGK